MDIEDETKDNKITMERKKRSEINYRILKCKFTVRRIKKEGRKIGGREEGGKEGRSKERNEGRKKGRKKRKAEKRKGSRKQVSLHTHTLHYTVVRSLNREELNLCAYIRRLHRTGGFI